LPFSEFERDACDVCGAQQGICQRAPESKLGRFPSDIGSGHSSSQADVQKIPGENYIVADAPHPPRLRLVEVRRIG